MTQMNPIFLRIRRSPGLRVAPQGFAAVLLGVLAVLCPALPAQSVNSDAEFKKAVQQISQARLEGTTENVDPQENALGYLDSVVLRLLGNPAGPDLDAANQQLAGLVGHDPPVGENYRLMSLGGKSPSYALVVNFGLGGPAAVRIYTGMSGRYTRAAQIDSFLQKDFFDSDIELLVISPDDGIFVITSGRTDDLATGVFSAWRFDGHTLTALWTSDPLEHSSYEIGPDGFRVSYCAKTDDDHPGQCLEMARDVYRFEGGAWKRVTNTTLGPDQAP